MRKPELTPEMKKKIIGCIREHPKNISRICGLIEENLSVSVHSPYHILFSKKVNHKYL